MAIGVHEDTDIVVPELGQVVRCRDRIWVVNEGTPSSLPGTRCPVPGPSTSCGCRLSRTTGSALEDDGFGDELTVIWEIEPGTQVLPHQELPKPVLSQLDRAIDARKVEVQLILESAAHLQGGGGAQAYANCAVYEWPPADRVRYRRIVR